MNENRNHTFCKPLDFLGVLLIVSGMVKGYTDLST